MRAVIKGTGAYLPDRVITNEELSKSVDTSDEWIKSRTGISQRHFASADQVTSDLAAKAVQSALQDAGIEADDVDLLICATTTPDHIFPATAVSIQEKIGMTKGAAFDVQAVCSGFLYGLSVANAFLKSGQAKTVVLVGAEIMSRLLNMEDRATCVLFGDGAGALVLQSEDGDGVSDILSTHLHSDGRYRESLFVPHGVAQSEPLAPWIHMEGPDVFKHAVTNLASVAGEALEHNGVSPDEVDWLVPHQANKRIIASMARHMDLDMSKVIVTIDQHANTSAASVPLALDAGIKSGRIRKGQLLLLEAMGGGFTWGSALVRY